MHALGGTGTTSAAARYPVGGAARIAATILPVMAAASGRVLINAEVAEIVLAGGRAVGVRMAETGEVISAPLIVSDAGVVNTFGRLLPAELPAIAAIRADLRTAPPSTAHVALYVGLRGTARELGLPRADLYDPSRRAPRAHPRRDRSVGAARGLHLVSLGEGPRLRAPLSRQGDDRSGVVRTLGAVRAVARDALAQARGEEYDAVKSGLAAHLLAMLETHVPQVRGRVDVHELSTPLSTRHFAAHPHGEIYGLAHDPERFRRAWLYPRTPVHGLYLTGADVAVSLRVGGALMGAVMCTSAILHRNVIGSRRTHRTESLGGVAETVDAVANGSRSRILELRRRSAPHGLRAAITSLVTPSWVTSSRVAMAKPARMTSAESRIPRHPPTSAGFKECSRSQSA